MYCVSNSIFLLDSFTAKWESSQPQWHISDAPIYVFYEWNQADAIL